MWGKRRLLDLKGRKCCLRCLPRVRRDARLSRSNPPWVSLFSQAKAEEGRRRERGIVGTSDLTSATGTDAAYELEFDTTKVLSEMAVFRHKGFKTLGPGKS